MSTESAVGVVVIGRNEGERLVRCLASAAAPGRRVVYVDSGSTDDSVAAASRLGAEIVHLEPSRPFTAARARNAGLVRLRGEGVTPAFVQFVDGDCELDPHWIERGLAELRARPQAAVVAGRRRERAPEASVYNRLCDIEWDTPVGEALACGGDFLARVDALVTVGGLRETMIAGEEPELCHRLRHAGFEIWRLDAEMTLHDAAITRFSQWWRRANRAGHAYAETAWLHGRESGFLGVRPIVSMLIWAVGVPALALLLAVWSPALALAVLFTFPLQWWRVARRLQTEGLAPALARAHAAFLLLAKPAQLAGASRFVGSLLSGRDRVLIEYKGVAS